MLAAVEGVGTLSPPSHGNRMFDQFSQKKAHGSQSHVNMQTRTQIAYLHQYAH